MSNAGEHDIIAAKGVCFPVLKRLQITDYGLFPGTEQVREGLIAEFAPGLTVVLGANGLGKTTLVWILYRLLSGPFDITGLDDSGDLGGRDLIPRKLKRDLQEMFAQRVSDSAVKSLATLYFHLGDRSIIVARSLADLHLETFEVDGSARSLDETEYQGAIAKMAGLSSFSDWVLLLRHLTFYFEDRRELVWDSSAQRQILRLLFLPGTLARKWTETEREILKLDSRVRNLNAILTREENELATAEELGDSALDVKEQLKGLGDLQERDEKSREELEESIIELDTARQEARLELLKAQQERESTFRELEHAKLVVLQKRFPSSSDTARYILSKLLTDTECLVCGCLVPDVARKLEKRLFESECIVCGSKVKESDRTDSAGNEICDDEHVSSTASILQTADAVVENLKGKLQSILSHYTQARMQLQELSTTLSRRSEQIDTLVRRLPPEESAMHEKREELALLRSRVIGFREELVQSRNAFATFIDSIQDSLIAKAPQIKKIFEYYARAFLIEDCELVWSPVKARVGQSGIQIAYPAFELELASASFHTPVRRKGPFQVSESQREFIDLSFRMALMEAADETAGSTMIIDSPESSLDAVFVHRAADVLAKFASSKLGNCLVVTSNLIDGELIPRLLKEFQIDWRDRLVDLFEIAEPTAAVRVLRNEYTVARTRAFASLSSPEASGGTDSV